MNNMTIEEAEDLVYAAGCDIEIVPTRFGGYLLVRVPLGIKESDELRRAIVLLIMKGYRYNGQIVTFQSTDNTSWGYKAAMVLLGFVVLAQLWRLFAWLTS